MKKLHHDKNKEEMTLHGRDYFWINAFNVILDAVDSELRVKKFVKNFPAWSILEV